ncbi:MAG: hypothetical protein MSA15_20480 [Clostridium sp.]|nr:hypothetical protein [Clostridium sp.]
MKDSFNNEIQVGDRVLCIEPRETNMHRKNQIGTVARINGDGIVVRFDLYNDRGRCYPTLNIQTGYGNPLFRNQDIFIKLETHTEVEYRVGDKVLCYCDIDNDHPFVGRVARELNTGEYEIIDEYRNSLLLTKSQVLFLLNRKHFEVGDEIVVQKSSNFELLFGEGYNQSIPARVDNINESRIVIEMDDPSVGWQENNNTTHSYWTLIDSKRLLPREFSYSLPFVEYLKQHQSEIFTEQINSTEEDRVTRLTNSSEQLDLMPRGRRVSNEPRVGQILYPPTTQVTPMELNRILSNKPTHTKLIHTYNYKPSETQFFCSEDEKDNEDNLYLGIELEISGSSQDSDDEEDAREIFEIIQKNNEDSVYFKHDGSINGFEIVFHPHTVKAYNKYDWKEIFSTIKRLGYTNDDKKAGFHVHISRSYFGNTTEQNEALAKMVFLMYKFKEEIEPLAGRKDSEYATYSAKALKRVKENDLFGTFRWYCDSCGKYSAINCQHKDTFEIRIFDGVTDKIRFMDILNFIENLCTIVKCTSITDITKVRLEDFMPFLRSIEG